MVLVTMNFFEAKILADSTNGVNRITSFQVTYPRMIHSEVMTHRVFSRNFASSRARSLKNTLDEEIYLPIFKSNKAGMSPGVQLNDHDLSQANAIWMEAAEFAKESAQRLGQLGVHKQWANRMLEWFSTITGIITSTEWENFFELRISEHAQDEIRFLAEMIREELDLSIPKKDNYHLPYISENERVEYSISDLVNISAARCAAVSYKTFDGTSKVEESMLLSNRLWENKHFSPFEHQAIAGRKNKKYDNFIGWRSARSSGREFG